ncbi:MAG: pyruvate carboxylase subunit B [Chitinivibrionales bacterium]|nr:pyruvate carboxylase subunit B [Chitinivibrionales bacterium]
MARTKKSPAPSHSSENALHKIPLRITDTTLRDAHQSLWATRMRTDDIMRIIDDIDKVGFYSLEVWGGATFDVCLRFLRENPWERLRMVKSRAKNTPLQMLLRGQNLVGYRNYADDVVDRFVALACENGVDIFRVFDALNDVRNLASAIKAVKRHGGHAQGTLCYTISPVHTVEKFVQHAREQVDMGIDSLCIKDMAGILTPYAAERLVSALVSEAGVPIQLHCHATSGMATATYVEGVRAGAGAIDCAISSMAGFSAQPPVETLATIFSETNYSANLNMDELARIARYFADLAPKRRQKSAPSCVIDPGILVHQIPGGMISNFRSQLEKQGALDKLPEVLEEVTRVRKDLGYPPLVTPTSQIVGTMAVMNVLVGERYKVVPNEVRGYVKGLYGRSPAPIDPKFVKRILGKEKPITHRPADDLQPMLPKATDGIDPDLIESDEDIISYCILPEPAMEYFKWRKLPVDERPPVPADLELESNELSAPRAVKPAPAAKAAAKAAAGSPPPMLHSTDYTGLSQILAQASGMKIEELNVRKGDFSLSLRSAGASGRPTAVVEPVAVETEATAEEAAPAAEEAAPVAEKPAAEKPAQAEGADFDHTINAPLAGTFYSAPGPGKPSLSKVGDKVNAGQKVCVVEAMKLFNEITSDVDGTVAAMLVADGETVSKGQPLLGLRKT